MLFTDWIIKDSVYFDWGINFVLGKYNFLFYGMVYLLTTLIFINFFKKYFTLNSNNKIKVQYFLVGLTSFAIFNLIYNVSFPVLYGTFRYYWVGDYSMAFFLAFAAYAIITKQLFGIRIALTLLFAVLIAIWPIADFLMAVQDTISTETLIFKGAFLFIFLLLDVFLIRSAIKETKFKEYLQQKVDEQTKEIKVAYEVEKKARLKLEDLDKVKDEFITTAAHQLRTPLSANRWALKSFLDGTLGKVTINDTQKDLLEKTYTSNNNLINIVGDLLDTSSIDSKAVLYNFQEQDISLLLKEVVSTAIFQLKDKKIKINYHEPEDHKIMMKLDEDKLSMALGNLMSNAVDY
ncbi:MAG: HAMP domain-containing histidine kinase, partial [Hyphomicrobiaceae bacterium]|nr:HAMP domain-containing histidine kinase [Hyphomicrobiaceae bacterium]